uniref:Dicer-like 3 n=1 Tax=Cycas revoluta TaxID=3396 RepID=A0A0C4W2N3_CYCRE|nr:Dicer-like 3 [Cycas revoluta]
MASCSENRKRTRGGRRTGDAGEADDPLIVSCSEKKLSKIIVEPKKKSAEALEVDDLKGVRSNPELPVRRYQLEILQVAIENNTIVFLETGCGKTLISVLLMKQIAHKLRAQGGKCIIIFLAPTIQLVVQQFEVIRINTDLKVTYYYGAKGIDGWNIEIWKREFNSNEVLVMTPQILLDGLRLGLLTLELVDLLIFDECHHAWGRHPYAKIMNEYYFTTHDKPKIFGMTASPVIRKGVTSKHDCEDQIVRLEDILDSKVYTLKDRIELDLFVPTPVQIIKYYCRSSCLHDSLKLKLVALRDKVYQNHLSFSQFKDDEDFMTKMRKKIRNIHGNIEYCLEKLGLFCAYKAIQIYLGRDKRYANWVAGTVSFANLQDSIHLFLKSSLDIIEEALPTGFDELFNTIEGILVAVNRGLLTPKVCLLVQLILHYRTSEDMRCIIFVERVVVAAVISSLFQHLSCLSFINSDYLASATSPLGRRKQQEALGRLLSGQVNVLVCTDVVEEGIDVQSCSCVIRFDLPKTVRSFIQSRGRARQSKSCFVLLLERDNEKQQKLLFDIIQSEESMKELALNRNHTPYPREQSTVEAVVYRVTSTGATVNCDSSISFIYKYCAKLPGDRYYSPRPEFMARKVDGEDNMYECILRLPPNAPFQEVISPPNSNLLCAKQLACLEACKRLHAAGALDEYLQPVTEVMPEEEEMMNTGGKMSTGPGTTRRKELHSTTKADALFGSWGEEFTGVTLHVYKLVFTPQCNEEREYANFALLIEAVLDDDVASAEVDLFLTAGRIICSKFLQSGEMRLDSSQLKDAKAFQEILSNGIFGKLMYHPKKSDGPKNVTQNSFKTMEMKSQWVASNMYLLLPLKSDKIEASEKEVNIDWRCISRCASGARLFKFLSCSEKENGVRDILEEILVDQTTLLQCGADPTQVIRLASGPQMVSDLMDKAVIAVHTGKIYCIRQVLDDKTAESPFPISKESKGETYMSYYNYFEKKYGKKLKHVNQPLLQVKQSHRPHNLLTGHLEKSKDRGCNLKSDEANYVELPPELCLYLGVSGSVIRSLYFIPSVMHRLTSLMLASQLRKAIREERPKCPLVPVTLIMEALTTLRCLESFSFERLELLGDSFLKYAVSRHLFLKYEKKHEGQLSTRRSWAISNATLHRIAMTCNLPGYIQDEPFDPRHWAAPGMLCRRAIACRCNLKNLEDSVKCSSTREHKVVKIGKACGKGHRWMCSKTISDAVEALIAAHLVGGGPIAALELMKWMNMDVEFEPDLVEAAFQRAFVYPCVLRSTNLLGLESLLGYTFQNKGLLVEAITHASQQDPEGGCCYQRLEFLGDSVLDLLITRHLFSMHPGLTPGVLTDLRSAAVNNENFARVAVKQNIQKYLRHGSGALLTQITEFVKAVDQVKDGECRFSSFGGGLGGPKVLGDLVESLAGALLVDTRFDLDRVWEIMKPILSPIVSPETLNLHPLRELLELCYQKGYCISWKFTKQGKLTVASVEVQLEDSSVIVGTGSKMNKKTAKKVAAEHILSLMEEKGLYHPRRHYLQSSTNMTSKGTPDAMLVSLKDDQMVCTSRNGYYNKHNNVYDEKLLVVDSGDTTSKVEQLTASSAILEACDTLKFHVGLSKNECHVTRTDQNVSEEEQEGNSLYGGKMVTMDTNFKSALDKDYKQSITRDIRLDAISPKQKAGRPRMDQESSLSQETARKKPRLSETSENSRTSKKLFKEDNLVPDVKDISTQCWSPEGALTSSSKAEEASNHLEARHNGIHDNTLISTNRASIQSGTAPVIISRSMLKGVPRAVLHELCSKNKWSEPIFELIEEGGLPHTRSFVFGVHIPHSGLTKVQGYQKSHKKGAKDSAAFLMLLELEKQGLCLVDEVVSLGLSMVN